MSIIRTSILITAVAPVDSGFYPHSDLVQPRNRIRAWVDAGRVELPHRVFGPGESPAWPGWDAVAPHQWHGSMISELAAGNGWLSHGFYRGMAGDADLVLIQARDDAGRSAQLARRLCPVADNQPQTRLRFCCTATGRAGCVSWAAEMVGPGRG